MSSILTNASALTALRNLSETQKQLQTTQNQISTGLKVSRRRRQRELLVYRDDHEVR